MAHDWHLFDVERGYEVRQANADEYHVRKIDDNGDAVDDDHVTLTSEEFEQLREAGPSPRGLA